MLVPSWERGAEILDKNLKNWWQELRRQLGRGFSMQLPRHWVSSPLPLLQSQPHQLHSPQQLDVSSHFIHSHTKGESRGQFLVSFNPLSLGNLGQILIFFFDVSPSPLLSQGSLMLVLLNTHWLQTQQTLNKEKKLRIWHLNSKVKHWKPKHKLVLCTKRNSHRRQ